MPGKADVLVEGMVFVLADELLVFFILLTRTLPDFLPRRSFERLDIWVGRTRSTFYRPNTPRGVLMLL